MSATVRSRRASSPAEERRSLSGTDFGIIPSRILYEPVEKRRDRMLGKLVTEVKIELD